LERHRDLLPKEPNLSVLVCPPSISTAEEGMLLTLDLRPASDLSKTGFVMHLTLETRKKILL